MNIFRAITGIFSSPSQNVEQRTNAIPLRLQNFGGHCIKPISGEQTSKMFSSYARLIPSDKSARRNEPLISSHRITPGKIEDLPGDANAFISQSLYNPNSSSPPRSNPLGIKNPPLPLSVVYLQADVKKTGKATYNDVLKAMSDLGGIIDKPLYFTIQLKLGSETKESAPIDEIQKKLLPDERLDPFYTLIPPDVKPRIEKFFNDTFKG